MDLIDEYALPLPMLVILELMGVPTADHARVRSWSRSLVDPPSGDKGHQASEELLQELGEYFGKLFTERRRLPREDLISALVQAEEDDDRLTEDELYSMVFLLIFAGFETMVKLIGNSVLALLQHPSQLEALKTSPNLIENAVEELLRYTVPVDRAKMRYATEDVELGGQLVRRGERVCVLLNSGNRDEDQFDEPDILDITRKHNKHLSFGLGIHYCIGAPLARLESEIAISTILFRLPNLRLAVPTEALEWDLASFLYGVKHLPVTWDAKQVKTKPPSNSFGI
jgi:cytochrome P450